MKGDCLASPALVRQLANQGQAEDMMVNRLRRRYFPKTSKYGDGLVIPMLAENVRRGLLKLWIPKSRHAPPSAD
jgi:hypothetical protein